MVNRDESQNSHLVYVPHQAGLNVAMQWPCGKEILKQHIAAHPHGLLNLPGLQQPLPLCPFSPGSCQEHLNSVDAPWKKQDKGEKNQGKNTVVCKEDE